MIYVFVIDFFQVVTWLGGAPDPDPGYEFAASTSKNNGFAFGLRRVYKRAQDLIRQPDYTGFLADSEVLAGDDQRAIAFATHDSPFANSFP